MTARKAASIAMCNPEFVKHHTAVQAANIQAAINPNGNYATATLCFIVDGEYFVYGFDGCEVVLCKSNKTSSKYFEDRGIGLLIR